MRLGPLFRGTFEVQAGNRPLQGQSKPPVFTGGYDSNILLSFFSFSVFFFTVSDADILVLSCLFPQPLIPIHIISKIILILFFIIIPPFSNSVSLLFIE